MQNSTYWRAKECDKAPLGNVNKKITPFSNLCFILECGTFFYSPVWRILYHVTSSSKRPVILIALSTVLKTIRIILTIVLLALRNTLSV